LGAATLFEEIGPAAEPDGGSLPIA
jgi:hypothetical protein